MNKKEIIENTKAKVAKKYGLGSTLVMGHKATYWNEAMEMAMEEYKSNANLPTGQEWKQIKQDFDRDNCYIDTSMTEYQFKAGIKPISVFTWFMIRIGTSK